MAAVKNKVSPWFTKPAMKARVCSPCKGTILFFPENVPGADTGGLND